MKIKVGHLTGGKAPIYGTVPVTGSIAPFVAGQKVEVTFYLDGHKLLSRQGRGAEGQGRRRHASGPRSSSARTASTRPAPSTSPRRSSARDSTVRKSWRVSFPALHAGPVRQRRQGLQEGDGEDGLHLRRRPLLRRPHRARGARLPQSQRHVAQRARRRGPGQGRLRRPRRLPRPLPRRRRARSRCRSPSRSSSSAKGDKPFAIYPVSTGKPSTPTVTGHYTFIRQEPGYNSRGDVLLLLLLQRLRGARLRIEVPDYAASHGCVRTFIADQPRIYEQLNYGESIFVF